MGKLHQVIAVEKAVKPRVEKTLTEAYHVIQKPELFNGLTRTYEPVEETGERKPPESKKVQYETARVVESVRSILVELFDVIATKGEANCKAKADVVVGGRVLLQNVPVTTLLFIEKQLVDLRTFVSKLPVLDPAETWTVDSSSGLYRTGDVKRGSTRKDNVVITLAAATDKHPAQSQLVQKDVLAGYWTESKTSSAITAPEREETLRRIDSLARAVKIAREEANTTDAPEVKLGEKVLLFVFG